jgi:hypothetical protein
MSDRVLKVLTRPAQVLKVKSRKVTVKVLQRGARGPAGRDSNSTGGVNAETVQSMIDAEVGPTAPDPTLIFDQYLI